MRLIPALLIALSAAPLFSQAVPVTFRGKVQMADGAAPGKSVGIQKICTNATTPGPLTDKQGVYLWRIDVDFMSTRRCFIEATLPGYESTQIDISSVNPSAGINVDLKPITLTLKGSNPYQLGAEQKDIPGKGSAEFNSAMKALNSGNNAEAIKQLQAATASNPKFAMAWHNLGVLLDFERKWPEAEAAYNHAIEANPKLLTPYVALARVQSKQSNWDGVVKTVTAFLPNDKNLIFPEMSLHQAVAQYNLKDLASAETAAKAALNPKAKQSANRAEYVLGRILEAKGDTAGAKEHMNHYLELAPSVGDADSIKAHIASMGQPGAPEPQLEILPQ
jgi:Flp pilus assembly protein TadD